MRAESGVPALAGKVRKGRSADIGSNTPITVIVVRPVWADDDDGPQVLPEGLREALMKADTVEFYFLGIKFATRELLRGKASDHLGGPPGD